MNPRDQECLGLYLYGAGYFSRDENTLGILTGTGSNRPHFCMTCPSVRECEAQQHARVRDRQPAAVERYERALTEATRRGFGPTAAAVALAQAGENPYYADAIENFSRGHAERGASAGPLVAPKEDADVR